ncbi:MAG: hypothetical protein QM722_05250 [Piscinibacter sp.]
MALLIDGNANPRAHDYASPPFKLTALYIVYTVGQNATHLKVGAIVKQSKDLAELLLGVRGRVRLAVPCDGPRRKPTRPPTYVWVILSTMPVLRHELEQALVDRLGHRQFDPLGGRRGEFCDPGRFGELMETVDNWRGRFPDVFSESLWSEDAGESYVAPRRLFPYIGATTGLWVEPDADPLTVGLGGQQVPTWRRHRHLKQVVAARSRHVAELMRGHCSHRIDRLLRGLGESPAVASARGDAYQVALSQ